VVLSVDGEDITVRIASTSELSNDAERICDGAKAGRPGGSKRAGPKLHFTHRYDRLPKESTRSSSHNRNGKTFLLHCKNGPGGRAAPDPERADRLGASGRKHGLSFQVYGGRDGNFHGRLDAAEDRLNGFSFLKYSHRTSLQNS